MFRNAYAHITLSILALFSAGVVVMLPTPDASLPPKALAATDQQQPTPDVRPPLIGSVASAAQMKQTPVTPAEKIAARLRDRLERRGQRVPSLQKLGKAVELRNILANGSVALTLQSPDGQLTHTWTLSMREHPEWVRMDIGGDDVTVTIDRDAIGRAIAAVAAEKFPAPVGSTIRSIAEDGGSVETEGIARSGYVFTDLQATTTQVIEALSQVDPLPMTVTLDKVAGNIVNTTGQDLGALTLLSEGRSNFDHSPPGRIANIHKGLEERMTNVLIAPGATFSFNDTVGKVTSGHGWAMGLAIFGGGDLQPVPGGGLCQVATTMFRAAVHAGLPISKRRNHSIYVSYYEQGGVGLDATVYSDQQDLQFVNDTSSYLLVQAYVDGKDAIVNIYGTPDDRQVTLEGPYFTANAPGEIFTGKDALGKNAIGWIRNVVSAKGTEQTVFTAKYLKGIPRTVVKKYTVTNI